MEILKSSYDEDSAINRKIRMNGKRYLSNLSITRIDRDDGTTLVFACIGKSHFKIINGHVQLSKMVKHIVDAIKYTRFYFNEAGNLVLIIDEYKAGV